MKTTKTFKVPVLMTDRYEKLTLRNLAALMFEVSYIQAEMAEAELDMSKLRWIVYSWDLKIDEPIAYGDEIEIGTDSLDMKKFYAYRNFYIRRAGKVIARAYVVFLLIDIDRMRPVKTSKELLSAYGSEDPYFIPEKFSYKKQFENTKTIQVRNTDIDTNFHVNNTFYFDYIQDLLALDARDVAYVNIVYKNEIRNKSQVLGEYLADGNEIDFRLRSTDDETIYTYGKVIKNV